MASCNEYQVIYLLNLLPTLQPIFSLVKLFEFVISTTQNISVIYSVLCQSYLPDTAVAVVTILIHLLNWLLVWPWLPILPSAPLLCSCSELTSHNHRNIWCAIPELFFRCCWPVFTFFTILIHLLNVWLHYQSFNLHHSCAAVLNWHLTTTGIFGVSC